MLEIEFSREYQQLESFYQSKPNDTKQDRFWNKFRHITIEQFHAACAKWMDSERYFPTPAAFAVTLAEAAHVVQSGFQDQPPRSTDELREVFLSHGMDWID